MSSYPKADKLYRRVFLKSRELRKALSQYSEEVNKHVRPWHQTDGIIESMDIAIDALMSKFDELYTSFYETLECANEEYTMLPCPYCEETKDLRIQQEFIYGNDVYSVYCKNCDESFFGKYEPRFGTSDTEEEAVNKWNAGVKKLESG